MAALLAAAPVTGLVMSTASLPPAHAHSEARHSALSLFHPIVTAAFPGDAQRLRRRRGAVALRDQRPQQAQLLPLRGRLFGAAAAGPCSPAPGAALRPGARRSGPGPGTPPPPAPPAPSPAAARASAAAIPC